MKNAKNILFLIHILFASCGYSGDLGDNYFFLSDEEAGDVGYPYGSILYKSSQKLSFEEILIYGNIDKITFDSRYILIQQRPNITSMKGRLMDDVIFWQRDEVYKSLSDTLIKFPHGKESLQKIKRINDEELYKRFVDSLLKEVPYYKKMFTNRINYWIINKSADSLIGPLTKMEFETTRKELKIPDELKLD